MGGLGRSCFKRFKRFRRTKGYIVEQEVRTKDLDLDLRSKVQLEVRSEVKIEEFLDFRLGVRIGDQTIDK